MISRALIRKTQDFARGSAPEAIRAAMVYSRHRRHRRKHAGYIANQIDDELHDPRLYSNLRGSLSLESAEERVRAHRHLARGPRPTIAEAARLGWHRKKAELMTTKTAGGSTGGELLGLGMLAAGPAHNLINKMRGKKTSERATTIHHALDLGGLGVLAGDTIRSALAKHAMGSAPSYDLDKVPADIKTHLRVSRETSDEYLRDWRRVNKNPQPAGPVKKVAAFDVGVLAAMAKEATTMADAARAGSSAAPLGGALAAGALGYGAYRLAKHFMGKKKQG